MTGRDPRRRRDPHYDEPPYDEPPYDEPPYDYPPPEDVRRRQDIVFAKIANAVWLITFFIVAVILLRVVLLMINANEENPFVSWIYGTSEFFVRPFLGITTDPTFNGGVFEVNSLIAILIYVLIIYGVLQLVRVALDLTSPSEP
jgi:uncharacterized protein YggT (Ycf19 family)